jgi:DNA-directed RNA polymerase specialized sigma24 family protein
MKTERITREDAAIELQTTMRLWASGMVADQEVDDVVQEMSLAILECNKEQATRSYFKSRMRSRAINYIQRKMTAREVTNTVSDWE